MKAFRFRFASVENIKRLQLDELRQALAQRQAAVRAAEDRLLSLRTALDETYVALGQERQRRPDPAVLMSLESYSELLRGQIQLQARRVLELRHELEQAQRRLVAKHREKKVLEKLRERQHAEYSQMEQREDQKELDEAASHATPPHFADPPAP
jgi:flagellar FliJ protein